METQHARPAPARARSLFDAEVVMPLASGSRESHSRGIPCQQRLLLYRGQDGGYWTRRWAEPPCERPRIEPVEPTAAAVLYQTLPIKLAPLAAD